MPTMNRFIWATALLCSLFCAARSARATEGPGTVTGKVVDAQKKGVEDVDVSIYRAKDLKTAVVATVTADDGTFTLKDVPPGKDYVVKAVKKKSFLGVRAEKERVVVEPGMQVDVGNLELKVPTKKK